MRYTLEAGRHIYDNGKPFISIRREGDTFPSDADTVAHAVCTFLNHLDSENVEVTVAGRDVEKIRYHLE